MKIGLVALVAFIFSQEEYRPIACLATILPGISRLLPELHRIVEGFRPAKPTIKLG